MTGPAVIVEGATVDARLSDGRVVTLRPDGTVTVSGPGDGRGYSLTLPTVENVAWRWRLDDYRPGGVQVRAHYDAAPHSDAARCA